MMKSQDSYANNQDQNGVGKDAAAPSIPGKSSLEQANLHVGSPIQLTIDNKDYVVTLIGYLQGQGFIVTSPTGQGDSVQLQEGQSIIVRFISNKRTHVFSSVIQHLTNQPYPHLHLAYPKETHEQRERLHERVKVDISGCADAPNGKSISCVVRDISLGGALIAVNDRAGEINDDLVLTLHVVVDGVDYSLCLESQIRSLRVEIPSGEGEPLVMQGLAFKHLSKEEIMALAAFDLLPDWSTQRGG